MSSEANNDGANLSGQALVARELKRYRERARLNRSQLAKRVGYSRTYISTSEKPGAALVSEEVVKRIDDELDAKGALIELRARAHADHLARRAHSNDALSTAPSAAILLAQIGQRHCDDTVRVDRRSSSSVAADTPDSSGIPDVVAPGVLVAQDDCGEDDIVKRRRFLAHAAAVTVGAMTFDAGRWPAQMPVGTPLPALLSLADVEQVEQLTAALRALDYQHGGGGCRDLALSQLGRAQQLTSVPCSDNIAARLWLAVADLHNLVGWTSMDVGLVDPARRHFAQALELARTVGHSSLVANVLYRAGRLHLHQGWTEDALRLFQLGQIAAKDSGSERTVAVLSANEAWAYGRLGDRRQAFQSFGRARDSFARVESPAGEAGWVQFFGEADLDALDGVIHLELARENPSTAAVAVERLTRSLASRGPDMSRSRAFETIALAAGHLLAGDRSEGVTVGHRAADLAEKLRSRRVLDRLTFLTRASSVYRHDDTRELASRIGKLQAL